MSTLVIGGLHQDTSLVGHGTHVFAKNKFCFKTAMLQRVGTPHDQ